MTKKHLPTDKTGSTDRQLGSHMNTSGGAWKAIERGESVGCTAIQIFVKGNTRWQFPPLKEEDAAKFRELHAKSTIQTVIAHSIYLVNLASDKPEFLVKSIDDLVDELERCNRLGVAGLVMHPGAHCGQGRDCGLDLIVKNLDKVFERTADISTPILLECTAGQGTCLGCDFADLAYIIQNVKSKDRLGVCIDTCHAFAAGHDMRTPEGYQQMWKKFDDVVGRQYLKAIHVNDSKHPVGSRKDRHEHIGDGHIGIEGFRHLMRDESLRNIPMLLETEKDDKMTEDVKNMAVLRELAGDLW